MFPLTICVYACVRACVYACVYARVYACVYACVCMRVFIRLYVCVYACVHSFVCVCEYTISIRLLDLVDTCEFVCNNVESLTYFRRL